MKPKQILSTLALLLLISCGSSPPQPPQPLQWHYDEVYIAQFSLEEKSAVLAAQNDYQRARAEQMKTESELRESATKLEVAKNELKQGLLSEESAKQEKSAADASGDMNRVNRATRDVRVAELSRRAADEKVVYLQANQGYLKELVRYRQEDTYHREAKYELAKANLGKAKQIAPKGVKYENFQSQIKARSTRAQEAKQNAQGSKGKAQAAEKTWKTRLKEVDLAKGIKKKPTTPAPSAETVAPAAGE